MSAGALALGLGCTSSAPQAPSDLAEAAPDLAVAAPDLAGPDLATGDAAAGCARVPGAADRTRYVVVAFPYDSSGGKASEYGVYALSVEGALTATGKRFRMGRATAGQIVFTPDGQVGLVAQEDGTIGVFRLAADGTPTVVDPGFKDAGYAARLVMDPSGDRVYVMDSQWRESGGGVYAARIGCAGELLDAAQLAPAKLAYGLVPVGRGRAVAYAVDILDSVAPDTAHLLTLGPPMRRLSGVAAFPEDDAIVSSAAATSDGAYVLLGDNSEYSGHGDRLAVVAVEGDRLRAAQLLTAVQDPVGIALSPYGNAGLIVSGYGDAVLPFLYDASQPMAPVTLRPQPTYTGKRPQLPDTAVVVERGRLKGRVVLSENVGLRQMEFLADGTLRDLALTSTGTGYPSITGALGVQP